MDIGCGDGALTADIANSCQFVTGLDASASFIGTANEGVARSHPNAAFYEHDCRHMNGASAFGAEVLRDAAYDKVFSNAAMHWILRDESTRVAFFEDVHRVLKPGGSFVFEQGGSGNVAEVHAALRSVLHHAYGISYDHIGRADPWFFPSDKWMRQTLQNVGFLAEVVELEYRPTELTPATLDGSGGLEGWLKLMGASFLNLLPDQRSREGAVRKVCDVLEDVIRRADDGRMYIGYVRLRAIARKPQ